MIRSVLLCDDEPHIVRAAEFKLKRAGYSVRCSFDGEEAWASIVEGKPDLLITDCQMPRLDGIGLLARVRADARFSDLRVVMLTAKGLELGRTGLLEQHAVSAVIAKPFSPRDLLQKVEQVLAEAPPCASAT